MSRLRAMIAEHRAARRHLREERELAGLLAAAPTVESAHELAAVLTRR